MSTWRPARTGLAAIGRLFVAAGVIAAALTVALRPEHRVAHAVTAIVCVPIFHLRLGRKSTKDLFARVSTARALAPDDVAGVSPVRAWKLVVATCAISVVEVVVVASIDSGTVIAAMTAVVGVASLRNDRLLRQLEEDRGMTLLFRPSWRWRGRQSSEYGWLAEATARSALG